MFFKSVDESSMIEESPYIGKGRFRQNEMAREQQIHAVPQKGKYGMMNVAGSSASVQRGQESGRQIDDEEFSRTIEALDGELNDKNQAIQLGREWKLWFIVLFLCCLVRSGHSIIFFKLNIVKIIPSPHVATFTVYAVIFPISFHVFQHSYIN